MVIDIDSTMATDSLDITSNDWRIVRENLVQLHCEDVSWEQASDKIPLDLVRYLLGDLVQYLSTLVFLRGNRCLFTINWTHIPDSISVWENLLSDFFDRRIQTQVGHYRFTYMLSHVGPKCDDLVNIYCHAHWGSPHPSFRREDVWEAGTLQPMEHPEMLYLPPNLAGSTPRKPEMVRNATEGDLPNLEEMGHHELIDLVKKLLVERVSKLTSLTNPSKDATVAGHVSMNQESLVQSSQAILQGLAEGGYIHAKTPKFESFFGDDKKNKLDFDMWERQVLSAATSLKGQALMVISALPPENSWDKLLQALKIKYQDKASYDVLMAQFCGTKTEPDEKCASFGTRLEQKLNQVSLQYPNKISESMYWNCVRERFFHGLSKDMRTNLRTQFDNGANYYRLLELARIVESESLHEDSKTEMKSTTTKGKGKVSVATVDSTSQQIQQLQGAVKGLTKMLQGNQQITQTAQYVSQRTQNTIIELVRNDMNTLPQASPSQNTASFVNTQGVRGGRGGYRGRGRGKGRGSPILCYWCRDFLPKEQASHNVAQCPYQKQAKDSWWKNQLGNVQGETAAPQLENKKN